LAAVAQFCIRQHAGQHRFGDRRCAKDIAVCATPSIMIPTLRDLDLLIIA
jgi:hypothetical protein